MIKYKNISPYPLTFYGVTFNPNEIKEVPGFVNHPRMVRIQEVVKKQPRAIISIAKAESKPISKPDIKAEENVQPVQTKRTYTRRNKTSNDITTGGVSNGKDNS